jgi:hypothetical protein
MGISIRAAAKELGVSHPALIKAAKVGSLQLESDGTLDLEKVRASEWWRNHEGKAQQKKSEAPQKTADETNPIDEKDAKRARLKRILQLDNLEFLGIDKLVLDKLLVAERREAQRLDNEERKGNLVKADEVQAAWEAVISTTRSHLLLLPAKLSYKVAALTDPAECQAVIDTEIKAALKGLSEYRFEAA